MQLQLIAIFAVIFLAVMFAVQNAMPVSIMFFFWRIDASLAVVVAACFGLGALISALVTIPMMLRDRMALRRLRKQVEALQVENDSLQTREKEAGARETALPSSVPHEY